MADLRIISVGHRRKPFADNLVSRPYVVGEFCRLQGMTYCSTDDSSAAVLKIPCQSLGASRQVDCTFEEMQGNRLLLLSPVAVACSTAVSVEYEDALFLGEVIKNCWVGEQWQTEIAVEQILSGLASLVTLRSRLLMERAAAPVMHEPVPVLANSSN